MVKKRFLIFLIIAAASCKKTGGSLANTSPYPVLNVHVGVGMYNKDTVMEYLISIGCTKIPEVLKEPHYADYWDIKLDSVNQPVLYYHTNQNFTDSDSIMFRSIESTEKKTIIAVYSFSQ